MGLSLKTLVTFLFISLLFTGITDVFAIDHWEALVLPGDSWQYFIGVSEPPANWYTPEFTDSAWQEGRAGFGYGDGDDATFVNSTLSIYIRRNFEVKDLSKIEQILFQIDYDDAFIAYLNGQEIARSAGLTGDHPPFQQTATVSHEAVLYQGGVPEEFVVDPQLLRQDGNVLAIQIHNQSVGSSDLSAIPFLFAGILDSTHLYQPTPSWFSAPLVFESSNLPIVKIDTQGQSIQNEPKIMAKMSIINNDQGLRNSISDVPTDYDGWIGIEMRGNATQSFDVVQGKWSYSLETRHEDGSNNNVTLLDMPKDNDWILSAAFIDKTLMRDAIAYQMSRSIGRWAPRVRHVELVLNGKYEGVYLLLEKIKPGKNRLNIAKIDTDDIAGDSLTGGYIWDIQQADPTDVVFGNNGNPRVLKYPKPDKVQPEQLAYIRQVNDDLQALVDHSCFNNQSRGYTQYIDVSSFIDELIVQEATKNSDAYGWSGFFHKDRMGKICAGPVWDFDQAMANSTYNDGDLIAQWMVEDFDDSMPRIWLKLWQDKTFKEEVADAWLNYRSGPLRTDQVFAFIDSVADYLNEAQQRNFQRWPILGVEIWRSIAGVEDRDTYQKEVDFMKQYLDEHLAWMDSELGSIARAGEQNATRATAPMLSTPNPFHNRTRLSFALPADGYVEVKIYNIQGRLVKTVYRGDKPRGLHHFAWDGRNDRGLTVSGGMYFCILNQNGTRQRVKLIKF